MSAVTVRKTAFDAAGVATVVACCVFWGFQQTLIKATIAEVPPLWQATLRFAGATVLLCLWCRWRGISLWSAGDVSAGVLRAGVLAGILFALEFCCIYLGLRDTSASRLTVFLYTSPFIVALLLPRFVPSERLSAVQWLGLAIAFGAVALAFAEGFSDEASARLGAKHLRGDALALAAGMFWGLTTIAIRTSSLAQAAPEKTLFYQLAVAALASPLVSLALGEPWRLDYSAWAWGSLALQTAVGAFASYLAWMGLLKHYPVTQLSSFVFITPVCALLFGAMWLREPLSVQLLVALFGVAAGVVLINRKKPLI